MTSEERRGGGFWRTYSLLTHHHHTWFTTKKSYSNRHNINTIYLYNVIYQNNIIHLFCAALLVQVLILFRVSFSAIDFRIKSAGQQRSASITWLFCPDILKLTPNDCGGKGSTHIRLRRRRVRKRFSRRKHLAPALLL